ncbi:MAG: hypothetical protein DKM23_04985 [Candidatus Melainabacteria bacterium]|nr:MAG: hypothetical protein DKM23_04985 [Candidatus Melainabacteria bacterium]
MLKNLVKFIKYYGKNRRLKIFGFFVISLIAGILEFAGIGLIYPFLMLVTSPQTVIEYKSYATIINFFHINHILTITALMGILIVLMFLSKNLLMILCIYLQNKFVINWKNDLNKMLMKFYLNAPYMQMFKTTNSEKIYNLTALTAQTLETFVMRSFVFFTNSIITLIILALLFIKFPAIALFTVIFVIASMVVLNKFFKHKTEVLAPQMLSFSLKNNNQVLENIKNLKEIRIFSAEKYFLDKFNKVQRENNNVIFKNTFYASIPPYLVEIILVISLIILAGLITLKNYGDSSKIIASYGLILGIVFRIAPSLNRIQVALNHMNSSKDLVKKMNDEYEQNHFDVVSNVTNNNDSLEFNEKIKFEDVSFGYRENVSVIKDCSFEIKKGEFVGIIGLSGAGKTTMADILMGLLPVNSGKITVDNEEITEKNINAFRNLTGYVPQEVNLLENSFKNNVAWGQDEKNIDDERVIESLKLAQLYDFVQENGGINSVIRGLSQGQKQRLMIARGLYKNPEILIFDEATSSLDVETEHEITKMLTSLKGNKTLIAIAHRLSTLKECDKLIYLKDGVIVDVGTFEELENRHEDFKNLIKLSQI